MTSAERPRSNPGDAVATILLVAIGVTGGLFIGGLYLIFATASVAPAGWTVASIAIMVIPVITAVVGIARLVRRKLAFWVPLLGIALVGVLLFVLTLIPGA